MIPADIRLLLPYGILSGASIVILLVIAFRRNLGLAAALAGTFLVAAFCSAIAAAPLAPRKETALIIIDHYALLYMCLIALCSAGAALLAYGHAQGRPGLREEFFVFLVLAALGAFVLVSSNHVASLFLGLEILSVSLYAMIAYERSDGPGIEAGIKYLLLAALASALLLFGAALVYAQCGTMEFSLMAQRLGSAGAPPFLAVAGFALVIAGIGFKLALVPFHWWTPDVYEGAPAPAAAFIATVSKVSVLALFMRYYGAFACCPGARSTIALSSFAIASMLAGNLLAIRQNSVRRIVAYSSIAHMGYFVAALLCHGRLGPFAATYYVTAYALSVLAVFAAISALDNGGKRRTLDDWRSVGHRNGGLAAGFTIALVSLAGIPLTAGFMGKFYVVAAGVSGRAWPLLASLVAGSVIGLFYYFRIIAIVYERPATDGVPAATAMKSPLPANIVLWASAAAILILGIFPGPLTSLILRITGG